MTDAYPLIPRTRIVHATTDVYRELVAGQGYNLVLYDVQVGYGGHRVSQVLRNIAREYTSDQINKVVLAEHGRCDASPHEINFLPTFRLFRDGQTLATISARRMPSIQVRIWLIELIGIPSTAGDDDKHSRKYDLLNGVQLVIWNKTGCVDIHDVVTFLDRAVKFFQNPKFKLKTEVYSGGPFSCVVKRGPTGRVHGSMHLIRPTAEKITAAMWTDAVIDAYSRAIKVEETLGSLPGCQKAVEREDGYVRDVVGLLDKPSGDLLALAAMIGHKRIGG